MQRIKLLNDYLFFIMLYQLASNDFVKVKKVVAISNVIEILIVQLRFKQYIYTALFCLA